MASIASSLADAADEEEPIFTALRSIPRSHSFYLAVADTLAQDAGSVPLWGIYE